MGKYFRLCLAPSLLLTALVMLGSCGPSEQLPPASSQPPVQAPTYIIGPSDSVNVFVWRNPDLSRSAVVRPDGIVSLPLVEEMVATDKTPAQLARDIENELSKFILDPIVTVSVGGFNGPFDQQIRILGEATNPRNIAYRDGMTMLDVLIQIGGLTQFAAGNRTTLVRLLDGEQKEYRLRLDDLIDDADMSANVRVLPGDIIIIPETWF